MVVVYSMYEPQIADVRKEYARWLQSVFGSSEALMMGTFTFRNPDSVGWTSPGMRYVTNAGRLLESKLESFGSSAFVCVEEGTDTRRLHLHSLSNCDLKVGAILGRWWAREYGHQRQVSVKSREGVSMYVTKYVTKSDLLFYAGGPLFKQYKESSQMAESG